MRDPNAYTVIRSDEGPIETAKVGKIIGEEVGCPLADATSLIATTKGFLTREVGRDQAERLVATLEKEGVRALAVPCRDLQALPRAILLRAVRIHAKGLDTRTEWEDFSILWEEIRLVSCGQIRTVKTVRKPSMVRKDTPAWSAFGGPLRVLRSPKGESVTEKIRRDETVVDLFHTDPKLRFRFWQGRFRLEGERGTASAEAMRTLAHRIVDNSSGPYLSPGLKALAVGKDMGDYSFGNRTAFENYNRYLFLLERNAPWILKGDRARWLEI